jgi:hypothetical protein
MNLSRNTKLCLGLALAAGAVVAACSSSDNTSSPGGAGASAGGAHAGGASASAGASAGGSTAGAGGAHAGAGGAVAGTGGTATAGAGGASAGAGGAAHAGAGGASGGTGGAATAGAGGASGGTGGAATAGAGGASGGTGGTTTAGAGGASGGTGGTTTAGTGGASGGTGGTTTAGAGGTGGTPCGGCVDLKAQFNDASESVSARIDLNNAGVDLAGAVVTASVKIVTGEPDAGIQLYLQDISYASNYPYVSIGSFAGDTASFHDVTTNVPSGTDGGALPYDVHHVKQLVFQLNSGSTVPKQLEILIDKITITGAPATYGPYTFDATFAPLVANGGSTKADGGVAPTPILTWVP